MSFDQENSLSEEVLLENEIDDTQDDNEVIVVKNKLANSKVYEFYFINFLPFYNEIRFFFIN